ncbi:hypothetical protein [Methanothermobacter sp. K4]|uniref:hypothetical protein n=1 Tax=Methanothermobacter sp. K4 TaxID=2913262 RepID=UPI001EDC146D|nr:hypothetical protein [Methanothermobacter sp. K4]MCG2827843.1 hypothetical protein [Methanothermobacter sp. K4]
MDDGGYISSLDAVLGLAVVFILTASVINTHMAPVADTMGASDVLDTMASYPADKPLLEELAESPNSTLASGFLNMTLEGMNYNLTMDNGSGEVTVASRGSMGDAENIDTAVACRGTVIFRLYVWR